MTIQEMKRRKRELGYSNAKVAELSGVPLGTVQKIFSGETSYPRYATLQALEQVLGEPSSTTGKCFVNETTAPYLTKKQGDYTLKDYYAFPEDYRIELIDGVIYNMTSPASAHQLIAGYIYNQLFNHITGKHGDCLPMISMCSLTVTTRPWSNRTSSSSVTGTRSSNAASTAHRISSWKFSPLPPRRRT